MVTYFPSVLLSLTGVLRHFIKYIIAAFLPLICFIWFGVRSWHYLLSPLGTFYCSPGVENHHFMSSIYILRVASFLFSVLKTFWKLVRNFSLPIDHQLIEIPNIRKLVWKYPALMEQWFSNIRVYEHGLEGLLKHILLDPALIEFWICRDFGKTWEFAFHTKSQLMERLTLVVQGLHLENSTVVQEMTEPSELFRCLNLTTAQLGSQLQTSRQPTPNIQREGCCFCD